MFQKGHTFYADWRDRSGTRKRKAFATVKAALKFEAQQKNRRPPKTAGAQETTTEILRAQYLAAARRACACGSHYAAASTSVTELQRDSARRITTQPARTTIRDQERRKANRSFSSITLLVFQAMVTF